MAVLARPILASIFPRCSLRKLPYNGFADAVYTPYMPGKLLVYTNPAEIQTEIDENRSSRALFLKLLNGKLTGLYIWPFKGYNVC